MEDDWKILDTDSEPKKDETNELDPENCTYSGVWIGDTFTLYCEEGSTKEWIESDIVYGEERMR